MNFMLGEELKKTMNDMRTAPKDIVSFANDLPNICSLVGLLSALFGIYLAILGYFSAAMICLI